MSYLADLPPYAIDNASPMSGEGDLDLLTGGSAPATTVNFLVDWANLDPFLTIATGGIETFGGESGSFQRLVPLRHPYNPLLLCQSYKWTAIPPCTVDSTGAWAIYPNGVRVALTFKPVPYDTQGDEAFLTEELDFGGNFRTLPGSSYMWNDDGKPVDQDVGLYVPEVGLTFTLHRLPFLRSALILSKIGKVNSTAFMPAVYNCPIGTVLFTGAKAKKVVLYNGKVTFEVTLTFQYSPVKWNYLMKPDGTGFTKIVLPDGVTTLYGTDDLNPLLKLQAS